MAGTFKFEFKFKSEIEMSWRFKVKFELNLIPKCNFKIMDHCGKLRMLLQTSAFFPSQRRDWWWPTLGQKCRQSVKTSLAHATPHTRPTMTKRFTNLKINLKRLGLYIGAKMQLVSYEFGYFYQCIMTYWGPSDFKKPISRHQAHLVQN